MDIERLPRGQRSTRRLMVRFGASGPERTGFTSNVSVEGTFLRTNAVQPPGSTILLEFDLGGRVVRVRGRVMWAKRVPPQLAHVLSCGMGIRFIDPGEEWVRFVEELASAAPTSPSR